MKEHILRGRDVALYLDQKRITGVVSLSVRELFEYREMREYLSNDSRKLKKSVRFELTLSTLPLFRGIDREPFVLSLEGEKETRYEGCIVKEKQTVFEGDRLIKTTYLIESDRRVEGGCFNGKQR